MTAVGGRRAGAGHAYFAQAGHIQACNTQLHATCRMASVAKPDGSVSDAQNTSHASTFAARQKVRHGLSARPTYLSGHGILHDDSYDLHHSWHRHDLRLNLAQLDAEAAQLHLVVDAAKELQRAVGKPAHQVAAAVHAFVRPAAEGIGNKLLGRQICAVRISTRHARTANHKLAGDANWARPHVPVEHVG
eukprot:358490-Chlamydomonas_euryale.AAC.1